MCHPITSLQICNPRFFGTKLPISQPMFDTAKTKDEFRWVWVLPLILATPYYAYSLPPNPSTGAVRYFQRHNELFLTYDIVGNILHRNFFPAFLVRFPVLPRFESSSALVPSLYIYFRKSPQPFVGEHTFQKWMICVRGFTWLWHHSTGLNSPKALQHPNTQCCKCLFYFTPRLECNSAFLELWDDSCNDFC